ncbi:tripartite tricarboxylate transporter TctB family protein [Caenimonas sp. SL110]|uniref:tripartite tricarboxylate transporter TctB family protein n=1 Tax=Caenimonas sp. SL110 TaxID=1450524 RepID=UPI000652FB09|nr:tripartite tricarboxylate transporter TctB family protein [Caenimonas sp. SL110]
MEPVEENGGAPRVGVPTYIVEGVVAALILVLGLIVIFGSRSLGSGWTTDGPGAGYFPFYIGLILCISAVGVFWQNVLSKKRSTEIFVDNVQLGRVISVLVPALVYVAAVQFLGLYLGSAIYIALFMIIMGKYSWIKSVIISVAVITLFFFMFEVWFKVPLFKGMLDPLHFLGY